MTFPQYEIRLSALQVLRGILADERADRAELDRAAAEMKRVADVLPREGRDAYRGWGELLTAVGQLWAWRAAVREAEVDSDRYLRAARERAREILKWTDRGIGFDGIAMTADKIIELQDPGEVQEASECLLAAGLPLPFPGREEHGRRPFRAAADAKERPSPVVLFLSFSMNGQPVADLHDLSPNVLHDLEVQLRLSRWPEGASALELVPLSVEPHGIVNAPDYVIKPEGFVLTYSSTGRLLARVSHDSLARPLEVSYEVRVISDSPDEDAQPSLVVKGQRRLLLRCVDRRQPWYGNQAIEETVDEIRRQGREVGLQDEELATLLTLSGGMGLVAFEGLSSNAFPGEWTEAEFHRSVRTILRANPSIGSNLEEHPHAGGGIADLSLNRVRLELKVDPKDLSIDDAIKSYGQQAAQYAVGSDRRSAVLAVLCPTKEGWAPAPLQNDIAPRVIAPQTGGSRPVLVSVVLVRRSLAAPSSLSR